MEALAVASSLVRHYTRPEFFPAHRMLPAQVDNLIKQMPALRTELAASGVTLRGGAGYMQRIAASSRSVRLAPADCDPGSTFLFIDDHGRVAPCGFTQGEYGIPLAELATPQQTGELPARFAALRRR